MPFPCCPDARAESAPGTDVAARLADLRGLLAEIAEPDGPDATASGLPDELLHALSLWKPAATH